MIRISLIPIALIAIGLVVSGCGPAVSNKEKWANITSSPATPVASASQNDVTIMKSGFMSNLSDGFRQPTDEVGKRMLKEYGALFVNRGGAVVPDTAVFHDTAEVDAYQAALRVSSEIVGGIKIELQEPAMKALAAAVSEAGESGKSITPRGSDASKRTYDGTVRVWADRVNPGLTHWVEKGRISSADAARVRALSPYEQIPEIFKLEAQGIYFAKDLSKSIIYSGAPPGTSQHLSMLALDVEEHGDAVVREILGRHGWFQTVVSDLPHFTFLGVKESELVGLGLRKVVDGGRSYWVPDL